MATNGKRGPAAAADTVDLVKAYAKQEVLAPIKGAGRSTGYGVAAAFCLGLGVVLLAVSLLRFLQTMTGDTFEGDWSWVPYLIVLVVASLVAYISLSRIKRTSHHRKDGSR